MKVYLLWENDCCIDLEGEEHRSSPLLDDPRPGPLNVSPALGAVTQPACTTETLETLFRHWGCHRAGSSMARGSLKPVDQFHKVEGQPSSTEADESAKLEAKAQEEIGSTRKKWQQRTSIGCRKQNKMIGNVCRQT